ncbi:MAG: 3-phosphoshikimate 1-carboxyvinyltransferase, partial [Frankia sp.]|nr:3-phosphoshikimate 1-carboxyvinyltransferase [Frankia sp.]
TLRATVGTAVDVDVGNAGTVARFLPPLAALTNVRVRFDGDAAMRARPLAPLLNAMRALGIIADASPGELLPLVVTGSGAVPGGSVRLDAQASSQFLSALLLASPLFTDGLSLTVDGAVPSAPYVDMTVAMMRAAGARVTSDVRSWDVTPTGPYRAGRIAIEPDLSTASYFLAAAVATGGTVRVERWPETTSQPGALLLPLLQRMGAEVARDAGGVVVSGPPSIAGVEADLSACGELAPTVAALAVLAKTPSRLTGIAHLRGHETDRLAALTHELGALGADVRPTQDALDITPGALRGALLHTHADHRLAMAFAVIGLVVPGVVLDDVDTTRKTFPGFAATWRSMLAGAA